MAALLYLYIINFDPMIKQLLISLAALLAISCSGNQQNAKNVTLCGSSMKKTIESDFSPAQFDSICIADTLPSNLSDWKSNPFRDFETNENETEYLFIKSLGNNEKMYRVEKKADGTIKLTKREVK